MTTIVLADDHPIVRQGLRAILEAEAGFSVVGEADDGLEARRLIEQLKPDVLVLDLAMPGLGGLDVTHLVRRQSPQTRIVVLSMHADQAYVAEVLSAGALAYVLKKSTSAELAHAIREALAGRRFLSPPLSERGLDHYLDKAKATLDRYDTLTVREREVLHLAAAGQTSAQIAKRLSISRRTVEMHRTHLMRKLDLHNQTELVRYAVQKGIVAIGD
jgi:DNA-binding NarL/FixJ family response regulator